MRNTSAFQPKSATGLNRGLVAYWALENVNDSVGSYTLTNNNSVTFTSGKIGNAATFGSPNTNKYLNYNGDFGIAGTGDLTMSVWQKFDADVTSGGSGIFFFRSALTAERIVALDYEYNGGTRRLKLYPATTASYYNVTLGTSWNHFVLTRISGTVKVYLNGAEVMSTATGSDDPSGSSSYLTIGYGNDYTSIGYLDEFGIWNRGLSTTEITELYNSGSGRQLPSQSFSTKAYYPLNGNPNDYSGNQNTGTDTAITYPQGRFGQAAKFNGSTSNITHGVTGFPTGATARTISLWFKPDALPTSGNSMVLNYWGANTTNNANGLQIINNAGTMQVGYFGYANDYAENYNTRVGTWYHMIGTFDGTTAKIFMNGYQVGAGSNKSTWNTTGANGIIGMLLGGSSKFQGTIDEVIIESRAWTAKEVETYYRKSMLNYKQSVWAKFLQAFTISESVSLTETITNLRARNFSVSETTTLTESITSALGKIVNIVESISLTETLTTTRTFLVNIAETVGLTEVLAQVRKKWENATKSVTSWTNYNKSASPTWSEDSKSSTSWTETDKS